MDSRHDIYLITIESLRADKFDATLTPNIYQLSRKSVVFENFYCAGAPTAFSLPAIIGGIYPFEYSNQIGLVPDLAILEVSILGKNTKSQCH
jgi:membrane-anchored protein YejM (alkaline phosphatase superfamily)